MKKLTKILGVVLTTALALSLFAGAIPASAAPGENEWDEINLPPVDGWSLTDVGVMAIAPDGTMFASVYYETGHSALNSITPSIDNTWDIVKSIDGGFTWTKTSLTGLVDPDPLNWGDGGATPADIVVSDNWSESNSVYVGIINGDVYRLEDAGEGNDVLLMPIVDSDGLDLTMNGYLYDLDTIWAEGHNYVAAATDLDVFIFEDVLFGSWLDMEMATETVLNDWGWAVQVDFAPDFASSQLIWAVATFPYSSELILSSAISPGAWGVHVDEVGFENQAGFPIHWAPFVDIAFPDDYDSDTPELWVAIAEDDYEDKGNLWHVIAALVPGASMAQPMFDEDIDLGTVEVSGYNIMVKSFLTGKVWISNNGASTFEEASRSPADGGMYWGHLYMAPDFATTGYAYATGVGPNSSLSRTVNSGDTWSQIGYIDTSIGELEDIAFDPMGGSQPAFLLTENTGDGVESLWYTEDATAESVQWVRIGTNESIGVIHMEDIEYTADGSDIMMFVVDGFGDLSIWKSLDNGDTWIPWRAVPTLSGWVNDFVATDGTTIYAATSQGFWAVLPASPPITTDFDDAASGISIAVMGGMIAVGTSDGMVVVSDDGGATFGDAMAAGTGDIYVAFGPDGSLYAAASGSTVMVLDDDEFVDLEDSAEATATTLDGFVGLWVSPSDVPGDTSKHTVYAMTTGSDGVAGTAGTPDEYYVDDSFSMVISFASDLGTGTAEAWMMWNVDFYGPDANWLTPINGTFIDGEILNIIGDNVIWNGSELIGHIIVEGAESGAQGTVMLFFPGWTLLTAGSILPMETLSVTSSYIFCEVVEGAAPTADTPEADVCVWRLLIGEAGNIWENACIEDVYIADGLWGTTGSNILWTFTNPHDIYDVTPGDQGDLGIWALEDFLTGPVTLLSPANNSTVPGFYNAALEWEALDGGEAYEISGTVTDGVVVIDDDDATAAVTGLDDNEDYTWKVRVEAGEPFQSRWSTAWTFTTTDHLNAPGLTVPIMGSQDYTLYPSFVWDSISGADGYVIQISANADFSGAVDVLTTVAQYTQTTALEYDTNYYWRVKATSEVGGVSAWSAVGNFHTGTEAMPPVVIEPTPTQNITLTVPEAETPGYIWAIIAIGALLTLAVIVLIVRTRRVV